MKFPEKIGSRFIPTDKYLPPKNGNRYCCDASDFNASHNHFDTCH